VSFLSRVRVVADISEVDKGLDKAWGVPDVRRNIIEIVVNDYLEYIEDEVDELSEGYKDSDDIDLSSEEDISYLSAKYFESKLLPKLKDRFRRALQWEAGKIKVWRLLILSDLDSMDDQKLGVHWTYDKDYAAAYDYMGESGDEYLIEALAPTSSVNFGSFITATTSHFGDSELEIPLKANSKVYNVKVSKDGEVVRTLGERGV
jgi:hypothetical protein